MSREGSIFPSPGHEPKGSEGALLVGFTTETQPAKPEVLTRRPVTKLTSQRLPSRRASMKPLSAHTRAVSYLTPASWAAAFSGNHCAVGCSSCATRASNWASERWRARQRQEPFEQHPEHRLHLAPDARQADVFAAGDHVLELEGGGLLPGKRGARLRQLELRCDRRDRPSGQRAQLASD